MSIFELFKNFNTVGKPELFQVYRKPFRQNPWRSQFIMKYPIIITAPFLKVNAVAVFPFILVRETWMKEDTVLIRHERIHLRQEVELLILPFYFLYLLNYLVNIHRFRDHYQAYVRIIFEQEANAGEESEAYLDDRPYWAWRKFMQFH